MQLIENPMILSYGYGIRDPQEHEPQVIAVCAGCEDPIYEHEEYLGDDPEYMIHNDWQCGYLAYKNIVLGL